MGCWASLTSYPAKLTLKCVENVILSLWSLIENDNYSSVLGQYMFFVENFHGRSFFWTGAFFSKRCKMNVISQDAADNLSTSDHILFSSDKTIGIPTGVPGITVLLSWLCPRYQYHFLLELIFLNSAILMRPMAYFYSYIRTGNKVWLDWFTH